MINEMKKIIDTNTINNLQLIINNYKSVEL